MIRLLALILLAATPALAQQAQPTPEFLNAAIAELKGQRNNAMDFATNLSAQLQVTTNKLMAVQKELDDLKASDAKAKEAAPTK